MREFFKTLLASDTYQYKKSEKQTEKKATNTLQIATCALFIEVANADENFSDEERSLIIKLMKRIFHLNEKEVEELILLSEEEIKESVSLYEFTEIVDAHLSYDEKLMIIENLWKLILIDDQLHQYEDYFIRKIVNNLHLSHTDMIDTKLKVKEGYNKDGNS